MRIGIIFTGIIEEYFIDEFISLYGNIDSKYCKIVSTWDYTDQKLIDVLKCNGFHVVLSHFPESIHKSSVNCQLFSYKMGVDFAINNQITHVFRTRSDMYINDIQKLLTIYESVYCGKPIFLGLCNHMGGYLFDWAYFNSIDFLSDITFIYQSYDDSRFPEKYLQELFFGSSDIFVIMNRVSFSIYQLSENNVEIGFLKQCYREQGNLLYHYIQHGLLNAP
jgi:hypothetical protein